MTKKVSIIIPTFNRGSLIGETLNSVLNQTYQNWECIIVDDGSTDQTEQVVKDFVKMDSRFRYEKRPEQYRAGGNGARNYGFYLSKGSYIQYVDSDDKLSTDKIESQMKLAEAYGDKHIYTCSIAQISNKIANYNKLYQKIDKSYDDSHDWLIDSWGGGGFGQTMIWLTPRNIHEKAGVWDESVLKNQDGEFFCRVLLNAESIIFSSKGLVFYRIHEEKKTVSTDKNYMSASSTLFTYQLYEKHTKELSQKDFSKAIANQYYKFIFFYFPHFKDLRKNALSSIRRLGFSPADFAQNKKIYFLLKLLGIESTLKIIHFILRIRT